MEKNQIIKKRLHDETNIVEDNEPATKKQKIEVMPIASISNLPTEIKEKIIKSITDIDILLEIGKTSHYFKNLVIKHCISQIKNPFAFFSSCMLHVDDAINILIDVWLHGVIEIDHPGENLYVKYHNSKEDLLPKINYDTEDFSNEYGLILNLIKSELIVKEKFFFKHLLTQIQERGLEINTQGPSGQTLLHFYCDLVDGIDNDTLTSIKVLIERGANIFLQDFAKHTPLQRLIFRLVQNFIASKELTEKNTFPTILVELMLERFDKAKVIHALVNSLNDEEEFNDYVAPLLKSFLFLNHHPDSEIASLFKTNVEKSLHKKELTQFLDTNKSQTKINLRLQN